MIARLDSEVEEIALDRARIALADARGEARARQRRCATSNTATTVQVTDAELASSAMRRLALRDAELDLDRRSITAPIAGIIGILPVKAGNYVTTDTVVATIDDRSRIIDRLLGAGALRGQRWRSARNLTASPIARPGRSLRRHGERRRQPGRRGKSRTLRVQAEIPNDRGHAARRHVVPGLDAIPGRRLSVGRSAGHPVGHGRRLRLGDRATARPSARRSASSSATPKACWSTADGSRRATRW